MSLPRRAEIGVAHAMGETGKDLFRLNSLLHTMAVDDEFLRPLASFRKRICYANAYGTDFPVPASTAAFLSASSTYPHRFIESTVTDRQSSVQQQPETSNDSDDVSKQQQRRESKSLVIATLLTPAMHECERARGCYDDSTRNNNNNNTNEGSTSEHGLSGDGDDASDGDNDSRDAATDNDNDAELAQMSISLDSLGWKKVFVDMRKEVPRISIPKALLRRTNSSVGGAKGSSTGLSSNNSESSSSDDEATTTALDETTTTVSPEQQQQQSQQSIGPIHQLKGKGGVVSSKDVAAAVLTTALPDEELAFHWPVGHNMIVAFSRSRWSTYMNKAGRPVVDALAKELVQDIFSFSRPTQTKQATT